LFYLNLLSYLIYLVLLLLYTSLMPKIETNLLDDVRKCPIIVNSTTANDPVAIAQLKAVSILTIFMFKIFKKNYRKYSIFKNLQK